VDVFDQPLRQPDQRSCGAAVLVVHELLRRPSYAESAGTPEDFGREVLAMHRRVTSPVDVAGRLQLPWPPALGTPPCAIARQLAGTTGIPHDVHWAGPARSATFDRIVAAVRAGHRVPVYVGSAWLPRHVVLAVSSPGDDAVRVYEPASGVLATTTRERFVACRLGLAGWDRPWFVVMPARRTPA
jgi:hypothetical protein